MIFDVQEGFFQHYVMCCGVTLLPLRGFTGDDSILQTTTEGRYHTVLCLQQYHLMSSNNRK